MTSSTVTSDPLETTSETEPTTRGTQEPTSDPNSSTTSSSTSTTEQTETTTESTETTTWTTLETTVCIPFLEFRPKEAETKVVYIVAATSFPVGSNVSYFSLIQYPPT